MTIDTPNVIAAVIAGAATLVAGFFATRTKIDTALISIGPKIIEQQNIRIDQLTREVEALWQRDHECQRELAGAKMRIEMLERRMPGTGE